MAEAVVQNLKLCCRDFNATAKDAWSPVAVHAVGRAVTIRIKAPRGACLLTYCAGLNALDDSAATTTMGFRYEVVSFAGTDRNAAKIWIAVTRSSCL